MLIIDFYDSVVLKRTGMAPKRAVGMVLMRTVCLVLIRTVYFKFTSYSLSALKSMPSPLLPFKYLPMAKATVPVQ